jgi:hypothetical protein
VVIKIIALINIHDGIWPFQSNPQLASHWYRTVIIFAVKSTLEVYTRSHRSFGTCPANPHIKQSL